MFPLIGSTHDDHRLREGWKQTANALDLVHSQSNLSEQSRDRTRRPEFHMTPVPQGREVRVPSVRYGERKVLQVPVVRGRHDQKAIGLQQGAKLAGHVSWSLTVLNDLDARHGVERPESSGQIVAGRGDLYANTGPEAAGGTVDAHGLKPTFIQMGYEVSVTAPDVHDCFDAVGGQRLCDRAPQVRGGVFGHAPKDTP
jgi:hypothetical protein